MTDDIPVPEGAALGAAQTGEETSPTPTTVDATAQPGEAPKPAKGVQKRIDELTANWRTTERDRDYWRELALANQRAQQAPAPEVKAPQGEPTLEQFDFDTGKYAKAVVEYQLRQANEAAEAERKKQAEVEASQRRVKTFAEREAAFAAGKDDYGILARDPTLPVSKAMAEAILEAEEGPALLYYLGQNRAEAARISQLSDYQAAMAMGRIVAQLTAPPPPPPPEPQVSAAPKPAPTVKPTATPVKGLSDDMTVKDWLRAREKQLAARNG